MGTLLISSFLIYTSLYLSPGSPIAFLTGGRTLPAEQLEALKQQYHLSDPFFEGYWYWLTHAIHGDFGDSIVTHQSVGSLLSARAGSTITLVLYAAVLILFFGIGLGLLAGVRGGKTDGAVTVSTTVGLATPSFVTAIILITVFAVNLSWFPSSGSGAGVLDRLWHLTLPAIALAISGLAYVTQVTRAAVREELGSEHVQTARSRGLPEGRVLRHHVLRNAAIPITTVAGLSIAALIAGVAIVEQAFGLNGLGSYLIQAVSQRDFPVVQAICLILVAVFIITNLVVDLLYQVLDPRLRRRGV